MKKKSVFLTIAAAFVAGLSLLTSGCRTAEIDRYQLAWDEPIHSIVVSRDGKFLMSHSDQTNNAIMHAQFRDNLYLFWISEINPADDMIQVFVNDICYTDLNGDLIFDLRQPAQSVGFQENEFFRYKGKWVPGKTISPYKKKQSAELDGIGPVYFDNGAWVPGKRPADMKASKPEAKPEPQSPPKK